MGRIFIFIAAVVAFLLIITAAGIYWIASTEIEDSRRHSVEVQAKGVALGISAQINTLESMLEKMAADPELVDAVIKEDPVQIKHMEKRLIAFVPGILKLGVFLASSKVLDQSQVPHMGYADLDLVRESLLKSQPMMVQGDGSNRHLAVATQIRNQDQVIGILLVALEYGFLKKTVASVSVEEGFIQLRQNSLVMAASGDKELEQHSESEQIKIPHTGWVIDYWVSDHVNFGNLSFLAGVILFSTTLACIALFIGFRLISAMLRKDQSSVLKVVKDLMTGKVHGNYPVTLNEMRVIISTVLQYKKVLEQEESKTGTDEMDDELGFEHAFSNNFDALEQGSDHAGKKPEHQEALIREIEETGNPVSLPEPNQTRNQGPANFKIDKNPGSNLAPISSAGIYKACDIRGIAGKTLTREVIYDIGRGLGSIAIEQDCKTIVVARDGRLSSPALSESTIQGILSTGCSVVDIGLVPTPVLYFVAHHHQGHTGVMITGSHNPSEYNGIKMVVNGVTLSGDSIQMLRQRVEQENFVTADEGKLETNNLFVNEYIGVISEDVYIARPMKIVVDCGNGVAGELAPTLLKTLGCEVIELFCDIDGNFPNHHPDPAKLENLNDLIVAVKHYQADLGIAIDGDGDRLGVVDSQGKVIWPDRQMMLFAKEVLKTAPGSDILYDVKCSKLLEEQIVKYGGRPQMWKSGHSLIKARLKKTGAKLAGEMSGHIFFNDRWFGFDDAIYSAARLLEILSMDSRSSSEVFADFPDSINTPEINIEMVDGENFMFMESLKKSANFADGKIIDIDGLRVEFSDGWGLVRASNTTPSIVVRFEADTKEGLGRIQNQFKQLMTSIKPDINVPF